MITAHGLTKRFGRFTAVDSIDLDVREGRVVGFLGPNGAGKSTTLRMIAGYLPATAGEITVAGFDVRRQSRQARASIGYLPESTPLYPEMRVIEYLTFRAGLFNIPRRERASAIDMVIRRCWLNQVRRKPIGHLSKGYRQRVGLAAALLHRPPVLLLDEPTSGLDPTQIREMRRLVRELAEHHTVLLSTHILSEVEVTCDDVIIIAGGQIRAEGTLESVRAEAAKRSEYILETNALDAAQALTALRGVRDVREKPMTDGWRQIRISTAHGAGDLREEIARRITSQGGVIRELTRHTPSLEAVFLEVTGGGSADDSGRGGADGDAEPKITMKRPRPHREAAVS